MVHQESKVCQFCGDRFTPHRKVGSRQIACWKPECRRARKRENLRRLYLSDPGYNYDNVKRYRACHPEYQRQWRQKQREKHSARNSVPIRRPSGQQQHIPASLFVSPQAGKIQTELSPVKTTRPSKSVRPFREIQTELTD
jgi:hypothetical protein